MVFSAGTPKISFGPPTKNFIYGAPHFGDRFIYIVKEHFLDARRTITDSAPGMPDEPPAHRPSSSAQEGLVQLENYFSKKLRKGHVALVLFVEKFTQLGNPRGNGTRNRGLARLMRTSRRGACRAVPRGGG